MAVSASLGKVGGHQGLAETHAACRWHSEHQGARAFQEQHRDRACLSAASVPPGLHQPGLGHISHLVAGTQLLEPLPASSPGVHQQEPGTGSRVGAWKSGTQIWDADGPSGDLTAMCLPLLCVNKPCVSSLLLRKKYPSDFSILKSVCCLLSTSLGRSAM